MQTVGGMVAKGRRATMHQRTVLIVEDDQTLRELLTELLDGAGYAVLEADDGSTALRLVREHTPALVLLDHRLPDMSGLDVLESLRSCRDSRAIPVMLVSGLAHQLVGRAHGADRVVAKPFNINALLEEIESLVHYERAGVA
jgi:DNA-binding response OmpR family regulator